MLIKQLEEIGYIYLPKLMNFEEISADNYPDAGEEIVAIYYGEDGVGLLCIYKWSEKNPKGITAFSGINPYLLQTRTTKFIKSKRLCKIPEIIFIENKIQ